MPPRSRDPSYRLHKQSGQAIVTLSNQRGGRRDFLLGKFGTPESRTEYRRLLAEWETNDFRLPNGLASSNSTSDLTVSELLDYFWQHAQEYYQKPDGSYATDFKEYRLCLRPVKHLYGHIMARDFGPLGLKAVRQLMVDGYDHPKYGWQLPLARMTINKRIGRIKRVWKWGAAEELIPEIPFVRHRTLSVQGRARVARQLHDRFGDCLLQVPGFVVKEREGRRYFTIAGAAGLLLPVRDIGKRVVALKVRRDDVGVGSRYSYLSSTRYGGPGPGSPVHVPLGIAAPVETVRITEGEIKADICTCLSGVPTISAPGAANWQPCLSALKQLRARTVRLALDADAGDNSHVARALLACAETLTFEGFSVELDRGGSSALGSPHLTTPKGRRGIARQGNLGIGAGDLGQMDPGYDDPERSPIGRAAGCGRRGAPSPTRRTGSQQSVEGQSARRLLDRPGGVRKGKITR